MNEWKLFNDSVCVRPETEQIYIPADRGMQGEAMPYKLVSDSNVMLAIVLGLILIVIALQNEKKGIVRILRNCLTTSSDRANIFDDNYNSTSNIPTVLLCGVSGIMGGLLIYHYYSYSEPDFFFNAKHLRSINFISDNQMDYILFHKLDFLRQRKKQIMD